LVRFICFSLEPFPEPYQKRCGSVSPDEGPGRRGSTLRKRLHDFKRSPMSYSSRTANWGRRHSELERFERKPAPDLIRGGCRFA
jgi:hypothetical protein